LLSESVVLGFFGGALGCLLAFWSKDLIMFLSLYDFPRLQEIRVDLSVFAFSAIITLATSLMFGFAPAWRLSNTEFITISKSAGGSHPERSLGLLIVGQVAFVCVLLITAGLLTRTFRALENEPLGFNPDHLLTVGNKLPSLKYPAAARQAVFYQELLEKIEALPGVASAAIDDDVPFNGFRATENFMVTGRPEARHGQEPIAEEHCVSPDYFKTMRIPILRGRPFGARAMSWAKLLRHRN
jgi:hypothetical protein